MRIFKSLLTLFTFFFAVSLTASAQNDASVLNTIMANTVKRYNDFPLEKVYLHFDKPYYAVGDTIWFKAYLTIDHHLPSQLSRIIYVDVLTAKDSLVQSLKLQVKNSVAWASIPLSQYVYKKGNYRVVAYTNWMNNSDISYFFNKNITIGDAINNKLSTQVSLKSAFAGKLPKITAGIYYKNEEGNPLVDKKVSWSVQKEDDAIFKGKGVTDKDGFLSVSFINTKNIGLDSALLITSVDGGERKQLYSTFPLKSIAQPNDIQFFPEGGELILGLRTKIAFKALKPTGLGIDVKGTVTDEQNNIVAEISSQHLGMGAFTFTPVAGKTYKATVTYADGTTGNPELPKILTGGIALSVENNNTDTLKLKILTDPTFLEAYKGKTFFIIAKSGGLICFAAKTPLNDQVYSAVIPKSKFPTGIAQFTLFSHEGEPMSERIAFIMHTDQLKLAINPDQPAYNTRQKVKLNISAKINDQPAEGDFSISVLDDSKVPFDEDAETTILTNQLLTSDIRGYIEKPNYYFNHPNEKTFADLDVLMQTQGYRRFSYDGALTGKYPPVKYLPEPGITISGTLRFTSGIPLKNGNVRLLIKDKNYSANAVTNEDGKFNFSNVVFTDSTQVTISARNNPRSSDLVITLDGEPGQAVPGNLNKPDNVLNIDSTLSAYLKNSKVQFNSSNTLKEVVIKDKRIVKTVDHRDYSALTSLSAEADHTIKGSSLQGCNIPLDCIETLAIGMTYDNGNFYVTRDFNQGKKVPAAIFLRGVPVDVNALVNLNVNEIESVEIFLKDELGMINSTYGTNGVVVVNLKKIETQKITLAELKSMIPQQNEITVTPKGYAQLRSFYLPRYSGPRETQSNKVDTRSTIYWNPNVLTDKNGTTSVEFFNADAKGTYRAIIEGFDKDGNLGRQVIHYTIK